MPKKTSNLRQKTKRSCHAALIRKQESSVDRETRINKSRLYVKFKRNQESDQEKETRLLKNSVKNSLSRKNESDIEKARRLAEIAQRTSHKKEEELQSDRIERLSNEAHRRRCKRKCESVSERERRLEVQAVRTTGYREAETEAKRQKRLMEQNVRTRSTRNTESEEQTRTRRTEENSRHALRQISERTRTALNLKSAFSYTSSFDYIGNKSVCIGEMSTICTFCDAIKWPDEPKGMCCFGGKVKLERLSEPPEPLKSLLKNSHPLSKHFFDNIRNYNTLFQMTSFGAKEIREGNFMPTFKIQGQVHHLIGSLFPVTDSPKFLQIYFVSDADQVSLRQNIKSNLKPELIQILQNLLNTHNSYLLSFKTTMETIPPDTPDLKLIIHADRIPAEQHRGRYNAPCTNEVAVLMVDEDKGPRDIVLHGRDEKLHRVSELHRSYDPLQYPLIFVSGNGGYCINIPLKDPITKEENTNKTVSCMHFYAYRIMVRQNQTNYLLYNRQLFNQYIVDMMAKIISERLNYIRNNQQKLRAENYVHLRDALNADANVDPQSIGQQVILPSSFTGSPRYMHEKTQDAMTYVRKHGRPDLFITFTTNPEWVEIRNTLFEGQRSSD